LITDGLEKEGIDIITAAGEVVDKKDIEAAELLQIVGEYDGLIVRGRTKVTKEVFDAARNLKVVGRAGVGVDTSISKLPKRTVSQWLTLQLPQPLPLPNWDLA